MGRHESSRKEKFVIENTTHASLQSITTLIGKTFRVSLSSVWIGATPISHDCMYLSFNENYLRNIFAKIDCVRLRIS